MAQLPVGQPSWLDQPAWLSRPSWLGQIVMLGQVAIGLALIFVAWPMITATITQPYLLEPLLAMFNIFAATQNWLIEFVLSLARQWSTIWPPVIDQGYIGIIVAAITCMSLFWLAGNGLLLRGNKPTGISSPR